MVTGAAQASYGLGSVADTAKAASLATLQRGRQDVQVTIVGLGISAAIIVGMVMESNLITTAGAVVAIVAGLLAPPVGLVALAFLGPLMSPLVIPPPGLNSVLVAAIILGCVFRLPSERLHLRVGRPLILLSGFVLYAFVQQVPEMITSYAGDRAHDIGFLFFQLATGLGAVVAAVMVIRGRSPYPYLAALVLSAIFASLLAILTGNDVTFARLANLIPVPDGDSRATGPFGNPNAFGQLVAYGATLALGLLLASRSTRLRGALVGGLLVMSYALFVSLSRGAIAALMAGVVVLAFTRSRRTGFLTLAVGLVLAIVVYPLFVQWRLTSLVGDASQGAYAEMAASDGGRFEAVAAAPALLALSPVFGIGFGQYKFLTPQVTEGQESIVAHNWYGTILAEQGLLGVALWLLMMVAVVSALRARPQAPRRIGLAVFAALAVGSFFLQPPTSFQLSVLPAIAVSAAIVGRWGGSATAVLPAASRVVIPRFDPSVAASRRLTPGRTS